jgi:O-antigen/teichoic acid export membrane protein
MSTDYFPRLSSICNENEKVRASVAQQAFISVLIITPIILMFLMFAPFVIKILYTSKFIAIIPMVSFGILGMLFKAVSWSIGYILIAKGDSSLFIKTEIIFNIVSLTLNVLGYYFWGLEGLGFSFFIYYLIYFFGIKIIAKKRYDFYFDRNFYRIYLICITMCLVVFLLRYIQLPILKYSMMSFMILFSLLFVLYEIDKKMELKEIIRTAIKRKNNRNP